MVDVGNDTAYRHPRNPVTRMPPVAELIADFIKGVREHG